MLVDWPSEVKDHQEYEILSNVFLKLNTKIEHVALINIRDNKKVVYEELKSKYPFEIFIFCGLDVTIEGLPVKLQMNKITAHELHFFLQIPTMKELVHSSDKLLKENAWESIKSIYYKSK